MPKTTLSLTTMSHRPNKKAPLGSLDNVGGTELLSLFEEFCRTTHVNQLVDMGKQHYLAIKSVEREGRAVFVTTESGYFGNPGTTYDVHTHRAVHSRKKHESATIVTRLGLVCPPAGQTALFMFEREGTYGGGPHIFDMFKDALLETYPADYFPTATVVEPDAWRKDADLRKVAVTAKKWRSSIGGVATPTLIPMGELRQELRPLRGSKFFPRKVRDSLLDRTLDMSAYLGFPTDIPTETSVSLENAGRRKTFVIGRERTPSVQLVLTNEGQGRLSDPDIRVKMFEESKDFFEDDGLSWDPSWETGKIGWVKPDVEWQHRYVDAP